MTAASVRVSGKTADEEAREEALAEADKPVKNELPEERERKFRFTGLSRMRTEWQGDDRDVLIMVHDRVEQIIDDQFNDMFAIRQELYNVVRAPELEADGVTPKVNQYGWVIWRKTANGNYDEDWSRLGLAQQKRFLFQITSRMFEWEATRDRMWAEAMLSKTAWEEAFSVGWHSATGARPTDGDKTARAKYDSTAERYFAVYQSYLSRRAESLVAGMERLSQRIKDVHTA